MDSNITLNGKGINGWTQTLLWMVKTLVDELYLWKLELMDVLGQNCFVLPELPFDRLSFQTVASELYVVYIEWHQEWERKEERGGCIYLTDLPIPHVAQCTEGCFQFYTLSQLYIGHIRRCLQRESSFNGAVVLL